MLLNKSWLLWLNSLIVFMTINIAFSATKDLNSISTSIAEKVGRVVISEPVGDLGLVYVFEEYHTSRIGQIQIAIMLNRLCLRHGITKVGLEGYTKIGNTLDVKWFHNIGGKDAQNAREDVAVRMLSEGEINAAEFMAMIYPNYSVYGIENQLEYQVNLDTENSPGIMYLIAIAEKKLTNEQIKTVNDLINKKKINEAIDFMMKSDDWVKNMYYEVLNPKDSSVEAMANQLREIKNKANSLNLKIDQKLKNDMENTLKFFDTASKRSSTMVKSLENILQKYKSNGISMIIGAAHSKQVLSELKNVKFSCALFSPLALNPVKGNLSIEQFQRKNMGLWARKSPGTLGRVLNSERKPPPIVETLTAKSHASMYFASILIAETAKSNRRIPDDIWDQLKGLPGITIDRRSFFKDGGDIFFSASIHDTAGKQKQVWARVGIATSQAEASLKQKDLEAKLMQSIADLSNESITASDGGIIPPKGPPTNSNATENEGPGDGNRGDIIISRLNRDAIAVFSKNKDEVIRVGKLSG